MARVPVSGVYVIRCSGDPRIYLGGSVNVRVRQSQHRTDLRHNRHKNRDLQEAWNRLGEAVFTFEVIEQVNDRSQVPAAEQRILDSCSEPLFNIATTVSGPMTGRTVSEETRQKMRLAAKGRKHSLESREKMRRSAKWRGPSWQYLTVDQQQTLSDRMKGNTFAKNNGEAVSRSLTGKTLTETHKRNISSGLRSAYRNGKRSKQTQPETGVDPKIMYGEDQ